MSRPYNRDACSCTRNGMYDSGRTGEDPNCSEHGQGVSIKWEKGRQVVRAAARRPAPDFGEHQRPPAPLTAPFVIQVADGPRGPWTTLSLPSPQRLAKDLYATARQLVLDSTSGCVRVARDQAGARAVYLLTPKTRQAMQETLRQTAAINKGKAK